MIWKRRWFKIEEHNKEDAIETKYDGINEISKDYMSEKESQGKETI